MTATGRDFIRKLRTIIALLITTLLLIMAGIIYISCYIFIENKDIKAVYYVVAGTLILLLCLNIAGIIYLRHNIVQPFIHLYDGIDEIGLGFYKLDSKDVPGKKMISVSYEIDDMFEKIKNIISLISNLNDNSSFAEMLHFIYKSFSAFIPYNYIGVSLISDDKKFLKASYGVADANIKGLPDRFRGKSWPIKDTSLKELIQSGNSRIINDLEEYCAGKPIKPYNKVILDAGIRASITLPLKVSGEPVGVIFFSSVNKNVYKPEHIKLLDTLASSIAISLNKNIYVNEIMYSSVLALAKLAEARDGYTGEHLNRMAFYSRLIAELLYENNIYTDEIDLEYIERIERYSPLHDIGKVGIRDSILLKPGKLTPEEYNEMKLHTVYGADVLKQAQQNLKDDKRMFQMGIEIVESHHEKWDGSGYPEGKKGREIPLCARIVALADVFDALTSVRPYKPAYSFDVSMQTISEGRGIHFDPLIADVFIANRKRVEEVYRKFLPEMTEYKNKHESSVKTS